MSILRVAILLAGIASLAPAASAATVPADLQALEPAIAQLHASSAQFSAKVDFTFGAGLSHHGRKRAGSGHHGLELGGTASIVGEMRFQPMAAVARVTLDRHSAVELRQIGRTQYLYEPRLARQDGGRPWLRQVVRLGGGMLGTPSVSLSYSSTPFAPLVGLINQAQDIQEVGPGSVDGQAVSEFTLTLDPSQLSSSKTLLELLGAKKIKLDLFLAASGLPVRTTMRIDGPRLKMAVTVDIPALGVPFSVQPPPARLTISRQALARLQRRHGRRGPCAYSGRHHAGESCRVGVRAAR